MEVRICIEMTTVVNLPALSVLASSLKDAELRERRVLVILHIEIFIIIVDW